MKNYNVKSCTENGYQWVVRGKVGTRWTRKYFHVKQEALTYAERKNIECANQGTESLEITTATRIMAQEAEMLLMPFGKTIKDAVAFYVGHLRSMTRSKSVQEAVTLFMEAKTQQKKVLSFRYRKDLKNRLTKFAVRFGETPVANIKSGEIEQWLNGMQISPVTHDNYHRILSVFFAWAKKNRYTDINPIDEIRDPEPITQTPGIFTPEETTTLLNAAPKELLPYLAFSLFCGIRPEEFHKTVIRRAGGQETKEVISLDWAAVNFAERNITRFPCRQKQLSWPC